MNHKAFSLIETLIVLIITILLFSILAFSYQHFYLSVSINHELFILENKLAQIKNESINLRTAVSFELNQDYILNIKNDSKTHFNYLYFPQESQFIYHNNGNISAFKTIDIITKLRRYQLVFHIGSGHYEIK